MEPAKESNNNTLEEPVLETIVKYYDLNIFLKMRDLRMIAYKLKYVLMPKMREEKGKELRNCNISIKISI